MSDFWQEENEGEVQKKVPDTVVDLLFRVRCQSLPVDHSYSLYQALGKILPWIDSEPACAIHTIHGAESGNGWIRPTDEDAVLYLSKRTRFTLRLPSTRLEDAKVLENQVLEVAGNTLELGPSKVRLLSKETNLFVRHIALPGPCNEDEALSHIAAQLAPHNIRPQKMLTGRTHNIHNGDAVLHCCSVMLSGISFESSIYLQQHGLGEFLKLGCGIFLPHKDIAAVYETPDAAG